MSVTTISPDDADDGASRCGDSARLRRPVALPLWLRRLRRWAKVRFTPAPPPNDGWKPAGGLVLVIAPHPDDEVIGCGGTMRRHVEAGDPVCVIYLTRGENSRGYPWLTENDRQETRTQEAIAGCAQLGVRDTTFLNGVDGKLSDDAVTRRISGRLAAFLAARQPKVIYVPHATDNHLDHIAAFRLTARLVHELLPEASLYQYELWSPLQADFAVDITRQMRAKVRAIQCHRLPLDAFDYVNTTIGLAAYRSGTLLQRCGYAEAFKRSQ